MHQPVVNESEQKVLHICRRSTGELGGGGAGGPIYGELTSGSVDKILDALNMHCNLGVESLLLDIGSGRGLPSLIATQKVGCASIGIECQEERWIQSMHNLVAVIRQEESPLNSAPINTRCYFLHGDITSAKTLDPCTHIYMFDTGFPPKVLAHISNLFNASTTATTLVTFQSNGYVEELGFNVHASCAPVKCAMSGSHESKEAHIFTRIPTPILADTSNPTTANITFALPEFTEPLWVEGVKFLKSGSSDALLAGREDARRRCSEYVLRKSFTTPNSKRRRGCRTCERCGESNGAMFHAFKQGMRVLICAGCQDKAEVDVASKSKSKSPSVKSGGMKSLRTPTKTPKIRQPPRSRTNVKRKFRQQLEPIEGAQVKKRILNDSSSCE